MKDKGFSAIVISMYVQENADTGITTLSGSTMKPA